MGEVPIKDVVEHQIEDAIHSKNAMRQELGHLAIDNNVLGSGALAPADELPVVEESMTLAAAQTDEQLKDARQSTLESSYSTSQHADEYHPRPVKEILEDPHPEDVKYLHDLGISGELPLPPQVLL